MIFYHGTTALSAKKIYDEGIDYNVNKDIGDFGRGFYLTTDKTFAIKCAYRKVYNDFLAKPYLVSYNIDIDRAISEGAVLVFDTPNLAWGQFIVNNRNGYDYVTSLKQQEHHNLDRHFVMVSGMVADGAVRRIAELADSENRLLKSSELPDIISSSYPDQLSLHKKEAEGYILDKDKKPRLTPVMGGRR